MKSKLIYTLFIAVFLSPLLGQDYSSDNNKTTLAKIRPASDYSNTDSFCFTTFASKDKIILRWNVEKEKQPRGYKILRSEDERGNYLLISSYESNPRLSRQVLLADDTRSYFTDLAVVPGTTYWYKLICIGSNDEAAEHGPVSASIPITQKTSQNSITITPKKFRFEPTYALSNIAPTFRLDIPNYFESNNPSKISIYDSQGMPLKTIFNGSMEAGSYQFVWTGDTEKGSKVNEGVFIAVFENEAIREATKLILIK